MTAAYRPWLLTLLVLASACATAGSDLAREPMPDPLHDIEAKKLFDRGVALAQGGDLIRAEQYLAAAANRGYPEDEVVPLLIRVCTGAGRMDSALTYASTHLEKRPNDWSLRFLTATLHEGVGEMDAARRHLQKTVQQAPAEALPRFHLAMLYQRQLDAPEQARPHFEKYLELAPKGKHAEQVRAVLSGEEIAPIAPADRILRRSEAAPTDLKAVEDDQTKTPNNHE